MRELTVLKTAFRKRFLFALMLLCSLTAASAADAPLRRPISPEQPLWIIHIDTWNLADPQKIIDLIPQDIRPYVAFNISLSINRDGRTGKWKQVEYGYETAKSWLRTCAENRVWAFVQPASGGSSHISDTDMSVYQEFFRDYPNFLGFNYAEQFWGYDTQWAVSYQQRVALWANLMKLNQTYGGYLVVSFTNAYYDADRNPVAMMKRDKNFEKICREDPEHFIMCEKFTIGSGFSDVESTSLGAYLSGYAGQYGIRFDETGWVGASRGEKFPTAAGPGPVLEHLALTGETVIDGPELIMNQCSHEVNAVSLPDGYSRRQWELFPQFYNVSIDMFRKIMDGTVRIMSRKEVVDRTKLVLINDVNVNANGNRDAERVNYINPETLYDGLYKMDDDGTYLRQRTWFKKTGRYAAIPMVYQLTDEIAKSFKVKVNVSDYAKRWPTTADKVNEFNSLFPQEYTGNMYVGRTENTWITYNPFKTGQPANAIILLKYNTCDRLELGYPKYSTALIREYADKLTFYLSNYDNYYTGLKSDTIKLFGSTAEPVVTVVDRLIKRSAKDESCALAKSWKDGVLTLIVSHNGPVDITVKCAGKATGRLTNFNVTTLKTPGIPPIYNGPHQYEAENFNYRDVEMVVKNGVGRGVSNYTAQGYLRFGNKPTASIYDTVTVLKSGKYALQIKYSASDGEVPVLLNVNADKKNIAFAKTASDSSWVVNTQIVTLNKGTNRIQFSATGSPNRLILDNIVIAP